jgi:hypothetical protein
MIASNTQFHRIFVASKIKRTFSRFVSMTQLVNYFPGSASSGKDVPIEFFSNLLVVPDFVTPGIWVNEA